jgi:hypothetical protein
MILKDRIWLFGMHPKDVADFLGAYGGRGKQGGRILTGCCPKSFLNIQTNELNSDAISLLTLENSFQQGAKVKNDLDAFANSSNVKIMFLKEGI